MKKILALVLVLAMLVVVAAACKETEKGKTNEPAVTASTGGGSNTSPAGNNNNNNTTSTKPADPPSTPVNNDVTKGEPGFYNPDYNYAGNKTYKITYLVSDNSSGLYTESDKAYAHWAKMMNCQYDPMKTFGGDMDNMFSQLPQICRDYDGFIIDADSTMYDRVGEICDQHDCQWISFMSPARDEGGAGALIHPYAGFTQYYVGEKNAEHLVKCAQQQWPSVNINTFGFMCTDFSAFPVFHEREQGAEDWIAKNYPGMMANFVVADVGTVGFDAASAQTAVGAALATRPDIEYWLIFGLIDDWSQGAAEAIDQAGLTDTTWVTTFGGSALIKQWDTGRQTAWRSANFLPQTVFTEPVIGALYAFMNGDEKPDTIWPNWVNKHESTKYGTYAGRLLPFYEIFFDNYKHLCEWSDVYAGSNIYDYDATGITRNDFSTTVPVPDSYK